MIYWCYITDQRLSNAHILANVLGKRVCIAKRTNIVALQMILISKAFQFRFTHVDEGTDTGIRFPEEEYSRGTNDRIGRKPILATIRYTCQTPLAILARLADTLIHSKNNEVVKFKSAPAFIS